MQNVVFQAAATAKDDDKASSLRRQQRIVVWSIVLSIPAAALLAFGLDRLLPPLSTGATLAERIALALRCDVPVLLTMIVGVHVIANIRLRSAAIDPIRYVEPPSFRVHARYLTNTHEQVTIYVVATAALATLVDGAWLRILPISAAVFVVGRILFWIGYAREPAWRAPGISLNMLVYSAVLLLAVVRLVAMIAR
jgi:hypothetical protein